MYEPKVTVNTAAEVKAILGPDFPNQVAKVIDHIDKHCKAWIERSPFIVISSVNAVGDMDVSPRGDPPGFVKVIDRGTLGIPNRKGKHRGDTFLNVLQNPSVGIVFIVPRRREVVRVSGTAVLVRNPDLLAKMEVNGKRPDIAMIVRVKEAFFHCGKSITRSGSWEPDRWGPIDGLPTYAQALKDHANTDTLEALQAIVDYDETNRLY